MMEWNDGLYTLLVQVLFVCLGIVIFVVAVLLPLRRKRIVADNSEYLHKVWRLNDKTQHDEHIGYGGRIEHILCVNSKSQFDRTDVRVSLEDYLEYNTNGVQSLLDAVSENRRISREYSEKFDALFSVATPEMCRRLHIRYETFREIEKRMVAKAKLDIIQELVLDCYVQYTSPQGRNHYSKNCAYLESEIRTAIKDNAEKEAYRHTEAFRRRTERSKVTPSLRYDIMKRDGFRCCLCGRGAASGVELEVDHITPVSKGGSTVYENLQTLCKDCNRGKAAKI